MIRPLLFGIAILIAGATQVTAQGVPNFKVEQGCREVSTGPSKLTRIMQRRLADVAQITDLA